MKKTNQKKKQTFGKESKDIKLPLIKSNVQKGNSKETKGKNTTKSPDQKNNLKEIPQIPNILPNKSAANNGKLFASGDLNKSQGSNNEQKKKTNTNTKDEIKIPGKDNRKKSPKITEEKLSQLKEQRKQRLKQAKKDEEKQIELYEKLIEEYKNKTKDKQTKNNNSIINEEDPKVIISSKKAQNILEEGGMFDAYKHVLAQLCKNGLPSGNVFEYASIVVKNYEKKWKEKKSKMTKDKIDKYFEEKQKEINKSLENSKEKTIVNKSVEHREELKFIQNLDKTRSKRNIVPKLKTSPPKNDRFSYIENKFIGFYDSLKKNKYNNINKENEENTKLKDNNNETNTNTNEVNP